MSENVSDERDLHRLGEFLTGKLGVTLAEGERVVDAMIRAVEESVTCSAVGEDLVAVVAHLTEQVDELTAELDKRDKKIEELEIAVHVTAQNFLEEVVAHGDTKAQQDEAAA